MPAQADGTLLCPVFRLTQFSIALFGQPAEHWVLDSHGQPTGEKKPGRRDPGYVVPVAGPRRSGVQTTLDLDDAGAQTQNTLVKLIRPEVDRWRAEPPSAWGVTPETERLLRWWRDSENRELSFFFCQLEAVETIIWLTEVAPKTYRDQIVEANSARPILGYFVSPPRWRPERARQR